MQKLNTNIGMKVMSVVIVFDLQSMTTCMVFVPMFTIILICFVTLPVFVA